MIVTERFLTKRIGDGRYPTAKWIEFCRAMLAYNYVVSLYEARQTYSKYITVTSRGQSFKVRFSDHRPIYEKEMNGDCDFFVGVTNTGVRTTEDAIQATLEHFRKVNRKPPNKMAKRKQDKVEEESYGGTFGSVVTPSGSALVHNRTKATNRKLEADKKTS